MFCSVGKREFPHWNQMKKTFTDSSDGLQIKLKTHAVINGCINTIVYSNLLTILSLFFSLVFYRANVSTILTSTGLQQVRIAAAVVAFGGGWPKEAPGSVKPSLLRVFDGVCPVILLFQLSNHTWTKRHINWDEMAPSKQILKCYTAARSAHAQYHVLSPDFEWNYFSTLASPALS